MMILVFVAITTPCWSFETIITEGFHVSGQTKAPMMLTALSFHPTSNKQTVVASNGDIRRLVHRFNNYHYLYAAGQGLHAATRVHSVINL